MNHDERRIIDDLFDRLRRAEEQSGPRDPEAEALIARRVAAQPAAPYYMAQAIVVQQDALASAQTRIQELEGQRAERPSGGFLAGLFGGGEEAQPAARARGDQGFGGLRQYRPGGTGGGFLAGAMQTALGVAGGFLIANAISELLAPDDAAAGAAEASPDETSAETDPFALEDRDLSGEETRGDFDVGGGFDEF
jgi:uncharacterized protein